MTSFAEFFSQNPSSIFQNICAQSSTYFDEILNLIQFIMMMYHDIVKLNFKTSKINVKSNLIGRALQYTLF